MFSHLIGRIEVKDGWFGRKKYRAVLSAEEEYTGSRYIVWEFTFRSLESAEYHLDRQANEWMAEPDKPEIVKEKEYRRD